MGLIAIYLWFEKADAELDANALRSDVLLESLVAMDSCAKQSHYQSVAKRIGWKVESVEPTGINNLPTVDPEVTKSALRIYVKPLPMFSKEEFEIRRFDADGCVVRVDPTSLDRFRR